MKIKWSGYASILIFLRIRLIHAGTPEVELEHDPYYYRPSLSTYIAGTDYQIPGVTITPDYREEEPPFYVHSAQYYSEDNRPYRMSPHFIQSSRWGYINKKDNPELMGCYCTTVYKRLIPLAGCAVITTRHLLTTASSTELIVKDRRNTNLTNILGAWYDHNANVWNSSMYMTPARIHYHPKFMRKHHLNVSHPVSGYFDFAVWAATIPFYGDFWSWTKAAICNRGSSHPWSYAPSTPAGEQLMVVGFQFVIAWKKKPAPFFKYAVRTRNTANPCPKTEWGWYHCLYGDWAKFGIEPGAALHRCYEGISWRYDGLIGLNMFSMRLRSEDLMHYFHPVDTHPVLDFLYSAYNGRLKPDHMDPRFIDRPWGPPVANSPYIDYSYRFGVEVG